MALAGWSAWTTSTLIDGDSIADAGFQTSEEIDNDGKLATEIGVEIAYGATATEGVVVEILRDVGGTYQFSLDNPYAFEMPFGVNTTYRDSLTIPADIATFKVNLRNDAGAAVTATLYYRQRAAS